MSYYLSTRRPTRAVLGLRALVAEVSWLNGRLRWADDRVAWEDRRGQLVLPSATDLALARRRLLQIAAHPALDSVLTEPDAWLRHCDEQLRLAGRLAGLQVTDPMGLVRRARAGQVEAIGLLVQLLPVEALCVDVLPVPPAATLRSTGILADAPVRAMLSDTALPALARLLAALVLGAAHAVALDRGMQPQPLVCAEIQVRRAYAYGRDVGLGVEPALTAVLLERGCTAELLARADLALRAPVPFVLSAGDVRALLAAGTSPAAIVALAEAAAASQPLAEVLRCGEGDAASNVLLSRPKRRETTIALAEMLRAYLRSTADPGVAAPFVAAATALLRVAPLVSALAHEVRVVLGFGLDLPTSLRRAYLELLAEQHAIIWPVDELKSSTDQKLAAWLNECRVERVKPIATLLKRSGSPAVAQRALAQRVALMLAQYGWSDPACYRLALDLDRDFNSAHARYITRHICSLVSYFNTAREARAQLHPVLSILRGAPQQLRNELFYQLVNQVPFAVVPRMAKYLPSLVACLRQIPDNWHWVVLNLFSALPLIDREHPVQAQVWLTQALNHLLALSQANTSQMPAGKAHTAMLLGAALASNDLRRFATIFAAALQRYLDYGEQLPTYSLPVLRRLPGLRTAIADAFVVQPRRCIDLVMRIGQVARLGSAVIAPLLVLEPAESPSIPDEWQPLQALVPAMEPAIVRYVHAKRLCGQSDQVPPGLCRLLDTPRRLEAELVYLERALAADPQAAIKAGLDVRAYSLHERLQHPERMQAQISEEACERLNSLVAEAQLAAVEQQLLACHRTHLAILAGSAAVHAPINEDLVNATLLALDIRTNRRLLRRLLRAHVSGDTGWREREPSNAAFLRALVERGADAEAWLDSNLRSFPLAGVQAGRVRLHLESDPLRILQMGNFVGSCLSLGGANSFSTVTNACELNKRVIYATDGNGRIVGRQLIAVSDQGTLVGFHIYSLLHGEEQTEVLRNIFRRYANDLAARCRIPLAENGNVSVLLAQEWYDDGTEAWLEARNE